MKIKNIIALAIFFAITLQGWSQNTIESKQLIGLTPVISVDVKDLPMPANKSLLNKLTQLVTRNGFGSTNSGFILRAFPVITNTEMTPTAPPQFVVDIDMSLAIYNVQRDVIISEITIPLKGIDRMEHKAYISAINSMQSTNPTLRNFMEQGRTKIIDYYSASIPTTIAEAEHLIEVGEYENAMKILSTIPNFVDQYPAILKMKNNIFKKELEETTSGITENAKSQIEYGNYLEAMSMVLDVNPISPNAKEAYDMIAKLEGKVEEEIAKEEKIGNVNAAKFMREEKKEFDAKKLEAENVTNSEEALNNAVELMGSLPSIMPIKSEQISRISDKFGWRTHPIQKRKIFHKGVDIACVRNTPIYSPADGVVSFTMTQGGYGKILELDHGDGYRTKYAHLNGFKVAKGAKVKRGDLVALSGNTGASTGPHLHYEVMRNDRNVDPLNYVSKRSEVATLAKSAKIDTTKPVREMNTSSDDFIID